MYELIIKNFIIKVKCCAKNVNVCICRIKWMYMCSIKSVLLIFNITSLDILTEGTFCKLCFSYDLRGKYIEKASHWKGEHLNDRAFFRTATEPASLNINHVEEKDEGEYKCKVDFIKSPTKTSRVQLVVIGKSFCGNLLRVIVTSNRNA